MLGDNAERPRFVETLHRRGYRFIARVERVTGGSAAHVLADATDARQRLAVLPFSHLGEASAPGSFASGLTEELITQLGRLCAGRLGVIARSSCHRVLQKNRTVREIGDALRAQYLVEGTVRTEGDRVRITAQLIDARSETQLWAESYERPMADSLLAQSDVATQIVRSVAVELLPDRAPTPSTGTRHVEAYQNYLKGRYHWNRPGDEGIRECLAFYDVALKLDPSFVTAHGAMARATVAAADYYLRDRGRRSTRPRPRRPARWPSIRASPRPSSPSPKSAGAATGTGMERKRRTNVRCRSIPATKPLAGSTACCSAPAASIMPPRR